MLCYRCEHRAEFLETGHGPRAQCKDEGSLAICYMFRPCFPVVTEQAYPSDERPRFAGAALAARERAVRLMDPETDNITLAAIGGDPEDYDSQTALVWKERE